MMMNDDIHGLLGKYFSGHASPEEQEKVLAWVNDHEDNQAEFRLLENLWKNSGDTGTNILFDTDKAWKKVDARINVEKKDAKPGLLRRIGPMAAAASVILVTALWWLTTNSNDMQTIAADVAVKEVSLPDGSKVFLRKGSQLQYPASFSGQRRNVSLTGEAFFEVAHDASRPFTVTAAETEVRVLGTSFSVNTRNNIVELIVKTGRVQFTELDDTASKVLVTANERALFENDELVRMVNTDPNFNAWQTKQLAFNNTPLSTVAATLSNYYEVNISLRPQEHSQLSAATVTASFNNQQLPSVLEEISLITSYRVRQTGPASYEISIK